MSAIRAPGRIQEGTCEATTIWLDDRHEPSSTLWMEMDEMQRVETTRRGLRSSSLREATSLGLGYSLL
jgi:hypothetical protein